MTDSWIWDLERQGLACRLRPGGGMDVVLVRPSALTALSAADAVSTLRRLAGASSPGPTNAASRAPDHNAPAAGASSGDELSAVAEAIARGKFTMYRVRSPAIITAAELAMLEERRRKRSVPEPPYRPPPPPVEESLHDYAVRVIDDTAQPVPDVRLKLEIEGTPKMPMTDGQGVALAQWFSRAPAVLRVLDQPGVEKRLESRWGEAPSSSLPVGSDVHRLVVGQPFRELKIPVDRETTLIVCRPASYRFEVIAYDGVGHPIANVPLLLEVDGSEKSAP